MATDLQRHIQDTPLCDTHEHLESEDAWVNRGPDILGDLFGHYAQADLAVAGADPETLRSLLDASNPDIAGRFRKIEEIWRRIRWTGYGEGVRIVAKHVYGLDELTAEGLEQAQKTLLELRRPGRRLSLLKEVANLDHVQVDNFCWPCRPDPSGPEFFLYDLSWRDFASADFNQERLHEETGVEVKDLESLDTALRALIDKYGPVAVAVKTQHAYDRSLEWTPQDTVDVRAALGRLLEKDDPSISDRLIVGDWCLERGAELCAEYGLPLKIHTGFLAGHGHMQVRALHPGMLTPLLARHPETRFVLMHTGYPYTDEFLAVAKHYPNVWTDLCWSWASDPIATMDFLRRFIHTTPVNKLFCFGGDTFWPTNSLAYAIQARRWLSRALEAEVKDGYLTESEAISIASLVMAENQYAYLPIERARAAIQRTIKKTDSE